MHRLWSAFASSLASLALLAGLALARPPAHEIAEPEIESDVVGDVDGMRPAPQKVSQDTIWIADWTFDSGAPCDETGWTHFDNYILNDGNLYWHIETGFGSPAGIAGRSLAVGYHGDPCCTEREGYGNDWYQAIRAHYTGRASISLDYMVDAEEGFDFLQIESDSGCASFERVDLQKAPSVNAALFRTFEASAGSQTTNGEWNGRSLRDHGPGTHCVYIAFFSDGGYSPCDGLVPTTIGEAAVVDNIVIVDGTGSRTEDFEDGVLDDLGPGQALLNIQNSAPFGTWARLFPHVTDNDICVENRTCAWLWTDHTTPTLFNDPSMSFGPGGFVVLNWLDDIIESPWVSLVSTPGAAGTVIQFRRFPGNFFSTSRIVQNWSVRGKSTIGITPCASAWGHATSWNSLSVFAWLTFTFDMTPYISPGAEQVQIRHRVSDWQWIAGAGPPFPFRPGPGPYLDRTRIGRLILSGPVIHEGIDARSQAQDAFGGVDEPVVAPGPRFEPSGDRFGTVPFSAGTELGINKSSPNLIMGDSITVQVRGVRPGGETVTSVTWNGAIVSGPHMGKAPAPHTVGANGFFTIPASPCLVPGSPPPGVPIPNFFSIDLDDTYLRGGDVLYYFWSATDNGGGFTSDPVGLTGAPASIADAQTVTGGMLEMSSLPATNWDGAYLARIAADASGDLDPTGPELAGSSQTNCILYVNNINSRRRSGDVNRTSFMYALDRLGYRGKYDTYDHSGMGNTNNQLGGRATVAQAQGYNLIVYDNGNGARGRPLLPDGINIDTDKVDQAGWFRNWLGQAAISEAGFATLWMIGSNTTEERSMHPLVATDMEVTLVVNNQGLHINPYVNGLVPFTFDQGTGSTARNFTGDSYLLAGDCPVLRSYDALGSTGTAIRTHEYGHPTTPVVHGAIVMNRNNAGAWNTIMMSHPFFDIRDHAGMPAALAPELVLMTKVLGGSLPASRVQAPGPVDTRDEDALDAPRQTVLHQNVPNPFNPTTQIRFDLAQSSRVVLRIYDVAGRLVRTLIDKDMAAGRGYKEIWNGLDEQNQRVASGIYFYRLDAAGETFTKKMIVMK